MTILKKRFRAEKMDSNIRTKKMDKGLLIKEICTLLINDKKQEGIDLAKSKYPLEQRNINGRKYTKTQMCKIFLRDGFIDRYSGEKLLFPGILRILTIEFPQIFKYHKNWKMSETHMIYWELSPTIDHIKPVARGGEDNEDNWVTTSMVRNSAKANWNLEEIGWSLKISGELKNWDGLIKYFIDLTDKNPEYEKDNYVRSWKSGLLTAKREMRIQL